jgi:hypothetical protein
MWIGLSNRRFPFAPTWYPEGKQPRFHIKGSTSLPNYVPGDFSLNA